MAQRKTTLDLHPESVTHDATHEVRELPYYKAALPQSSELPLCAMSVSVLTERCMREMTNYRAGEPYTDQYCMELLHRALVQGDTLAWEGIQQCFQGTILRWIRSHPLRDIAYRFDSEENYVAQVFTRFWLAAAGHQQREFQSAAAVFQYLHMSTHTAILDTLRAYSRPKEIVLPEYGDPEEPFMEDVYEGHEVWEAILHLLTDERDQRAAYLLFYCGLRPKQIIRFCPHEFSDVQEVYRRRRNILEMLLRHADHLRWRLGK